MRGMIFNNYGVIVREEPDNNSKKIFELDCFDEVEMWEVNPEWYKVKKNNWEGYIRSEYAEPIKER